LNKKTQHFSLPACQPC